MSKEPAERKSDPPVGATPQKSGRPYSILDRIPARLWFPIGFVGFFFSVGGWNQIANSWVKMTGSPAPGGEHLPGLLTGAGIFCICLFFGIRNRVREKHADRIQNSGARNRKAEMQSHRDNIRFP